MKWLIASDIHGSKYFCERLVERYKAENADRLLLLGDILYHGPRNALPREYNPKSVAELLNTIKSDIFCIKGNCDSEVDEMLLDFNIFSEGTIVCIGSITMFATHGHIFNLESLPSFNIDIILAGHTHIPKLEVRDRTAYINPGSVSIPKGNSQNSYILLDDERFIWKNIDGIEFNSYTHTKINKGLS